MHKLSLEIKNKLNDRDWLYDQYIIQRKSTYQLAEELICSNITINRALKKHNIQIRSLSEYHETSKDILNKLHSYDWMYNQYIMQEKSIVQIGTELGRSYFIINTALKKHNIIIRTMSEVKGISKELYNKLNNKHWLHDQYIVSKKSPDQLGKELSCSFATVTKYLKKHNIPLRTMNEAQGLSKELYNKLNNKDWLYDQYITKEKNTIQLSKELGCCHTTVINYIKRHNIPINYSYSRSYGENQVFEFVKQYCPDAIQSYRGIGKK